MQFQKNHNTQHLLLIVNDNKLEKSTSIKKAKILNGKFHLHWK